MSSADAPPDAVDPPEGDREARIDQLGQAYLERLRAGEAVTPEHYAAEHADLAEEILETFPVLALMEGLKPPPPAPAPTELSAAPPTAPTAVMPTEIDGYRVLRELGRGGMGRVYEVHTPTGERAALKLVHPHLLDRPGILARFLRELDTGLRVDHPGVIRTLASGTADVDGRELPYLVLEFVEGETLRQMLMDSGRASERLAREIGLALADALCAVHAAGIVHRDVKPENVVIAPDERITLMDLGVALVKEEALRLTQTGEFVGSLLYAAPEQLRSREVDARTDLYALGLLLFEMVAGRHPEAAGGGSVLSRRFGQSRAPRLRSVVPHVTPFFDRVVQTLMATDPDERFADAESLGRVLREGEDSAWWTEQQARVRKNDRPRRYAEALPLTGRDDVLDRFDGIFEKAEEGQGRVLVLRGEAGLGKSHLLSTWLDRAEAATPEVAILYIEYAPGAGAMGLTPLAAALRPHLRDVDAETLTGWLGPYSEKVGAFRAALALDDPNGTPSPGALDRASLELYSVMIIRALSRDAPVVIVLEDLHFASLEGRALFERLTHVFRDDAVLLLGTTRPAEPPIPDPALERFEHVDVVELEGLDGHAAVELLSLVLGTDPTQPEVIERLVRKSDGNPYCLLEFARVLKDTSLPDRLMADDVELPGGVRRLVEDRLAALEPADRELLEVAACDGYRFDPVLVCETAGLARIAGLRALHRLERERGLITAEGAQYRFHHHLVQESLRGSLPPALLAAYHSALATTLEAHVGGEAPPPATCYALARHFLLGEAPERARPYVEAGLGHLLALSEQRRAGEMARRTLDLVPDLPAAFRARLWLIHGRAVDGRVGQEVVLDIAEKAVAAAREGDDGGVLVDALDALSGATAQSGRHLDAVPVVAEALRVAEALDDHARLAHMRCMDAMVAFDLGEHERSIATANRALALAQEVGDAALTGRIALYFASINLEIDGVEAALPQAEFALATAQLHGNNELILNALTILGRIANTRGRPREALRLLTRGRNLARDLGMMRRATLSNNGMAQALLNCGEYDEAARLAGEGLAINERMGWPELVVLQSLPYQLVMSARGELASGHAAVARAEELLEHVSLPTIASRVMPSYATQLAWLGAFDEAAAAIERGQEALDKVYTVREATQLARARATLLDATGDQDASIEAYMATIGLADEANLPVFATLMRARVGGLLVVTGRHDEAHACLSTALEQATAGEMQPTADEARGWLALADDQHEQLRVALRSPDTRLPAWAAFRLQAELARATEDTRDRAEAARRARALRDAAPEAYRTSIADVGPMRALLAEGT